MKKTLLCGALALSVLSSFTLPTAFASSAGIEQAASDSLITAKIKDLYAEYPALHEANIFVKTHQQNVTLSGQLKTSSQYERAIILADSVKGVRGIHAKQLTVKSSNKPLRDTFVTAKVKSVFIKEGLLGSKGISSWPIKVETKDAVVYLSGHAKTDAERKHLLTLARQVSGVKAVNSSIQVKS